MSNPVVLITGALTGIGRAAAVAFAKKGAKVVVAGRRDERLAGLITPTGNDHFRALLGEGDGGGAPDAGQSAGDQDDWVTHFPVPHGFIFPAGGAWIAPPRS